MTRRRRVLATAAGIVLGGVLLYGGLPRLHGVREAYDQARSGSGWWLTLGIALELCSFAGYAALFGAVFGGGRIDRSASWLITLAGVAATRLLNTAGAGGIALTAWAVRRAGSDGRTVAADLTAFMLLLYGVYMAALAIAGAALLTGVLPGAAPTALAASGLAVAAAAIVVVPLLGFVPRRSREGGARRFGRALDVLDGIPAGVRRARELLVARDPRLLGAAAWWAFDIAALGAALHAVHAGLPVAALVLAYFVGMMGNLLPLPGGLGGVEGGMIGTLTACGAELASAVVAVLAYRLVSLWIPTLCGLVAIPLLRRRMRDWPGPAAP